tara:strand:- start:280 stop:459 length:180 start_codon:yes stop_codon:yes gene_type:complete
MDWLMLYIAIQFLDDFNKSIAMKQIAKDEVINYQLSNIEFHFETLHPIDTEKWLTDQSS